MRYYRTTTGVVMTTGSIIGTEITESEYFAEIQAAEERGAQKDIIIERTRPLTAEEVTAMLIRQQINGLTVDDTTALRMVEFYPGWVAGQNYTAGYKVQRGGRLWRCVQAHASQTGWEPENAPSLWAKVLIPDETVIPEWEQPDSTNAYSKGDKVTHNGKTWVSDVDGNVWEPGVYGWTEHSE